VFVVEHFVENVTLSIFHKFDPIVSNDTARASKKCEIPPEPFVFSTQLFDPVVHELFLHGTPFPGMNVCHIFPSYGLILRCFANCFSEGLSPFKG
jgi:hypothetical protein